MSKGQSGYRDRLTRSSLFNIFCRDGENSEYFDHDLEDDVGHCCGGPHFRIGLQSAEKALDAHKKIRNHVLARIGVLGRLVKSESRTSGLYEIHGDPHLEKNANPSKYNFCRRKYLIDDDQSLESAEICIRDSPDRRPRRERWKTQRGR